MNIDLAALRALAQEREIPVETILAAIETALLTAYRHTEGSQAHARVEIDRRTGVATVYAQELDETGATVREWDDTPHDFGRIAAMTAKQVILQRLREATDEVHYGEYVGRDGDLVTGVIQAHEGRSEKGIVSVDLGKLEAMLPASEQVPGEVYEHGQRIKCVVVREQKLDDEPEDDRRAHQSCRNREQDNRRSQEARMTRQQVAGPAEPGQECRNGREVEQGHLWATTDSRAATPYMRSRHMAV